MTDWKELARKHEGSANEYARMNYELAEVNKQLLDACIYTLRMLTKIKRTEICIGADKVSREKLERAISDARHAGCP